MKYCRFLLADQIHYGAVEERKGELWITGPAPAPEEDLALQAGAWSRLRRRALTLSRCR